MSTEIKITVESKGDPSQAKNKALFKDLQDLMSKHGLPASSTHYKDKEIQHTKNNECEGEHWFYRIMRETHTPPDPVLMRQAAKAYWARLFQGVSELDDRPVKIMMSRSHWEDLTRNLDDVKACEEAEMVFGCPIEIVPNEIARKKYREFLTHGRSLVYTECGRVGTYMGGCHYHAHGEMTWLNWNLDEADWAYPNAQLRG